MWYHLLSHYFIHFVTFISSNSSAIHDILVSRNWWFIHTSEKFMILSHSIRACTIVHTIPIMVRYSVPFGTEFVTQSLNHHERQNRGLWSIGMSPPKLKYLVSSLKSTKSLSLKYMVTLWLVDLVYFSK